MIQLSTDRLRVEILEPMEGTNKGFRFDHAGFVSEVELDGMIKFMATEPKNLRHLCTLGRGLCNEYRFDISEDVKVGDWFPKFGIGLFRKEEDKKYIFHDVYKEVEYYPVHVSHDETCAVFETEPILCHGYALKTKKTIRVEGNTVTMEIEATNAGEKPITDMDEFCHNFISIDGMAVGSDYVLDLPQCPDLGNERLLNRNGWKCSLRGNGKGLTFCEMCAVDSDYAFDISQVDRSVPFTWKLSHKGAKASVSGLCGFEVGKAVVWSVDHMVCPEITNVVSLAAGETKSWYYQWTFEREA